MYITFISNFSLLLRYVACLGTFHQQLKNKIMNLSNFELLRQGAEAKLHKGVYLGRPAIVKERFSKKYRHPDLDARLTKDRCKAEVRALIKCKNLGIRTPKIYNVHQEFIVMEYLDCPTARDYIRELLNNQNVINDDQKVALESLGARIGAILGQLHKNHVIHGDLTTSNILVESETKLCLIDFGLGHSEGSAEDKGVDLYVLERALISAHPNTEFMFEAILKSYQDQLEDSMRIEVIRKFEEIRMRGRKRTMVG